MKIFRLIFISLLALIIMSGLALTAQAASPQQGAALYTPTAQPDGRIIYIVQPGDNCIKVSLLMGVPIETLRGLNKLDTNCTLVDGQELLIGVVAPATSTPIPPSNSTPTPTPLPGFAKVCVLLYNDMNGDAKRQAKEDANGIIPADSEPAIEGGAVSLTNVNGNYSQTQTTISGYEPICFENVPEGDYNASVAIPDGYNATTAGSTTFSAHAGETDVLAFGAQSKTQGGSTDAQPRSPILGWVGGGFLLLGVILAFFASRMRTGPNKVRLGPR